MPNLILLQSVEDVMEEKKRAEDEVKKLKE